MPDAFRIRADLNETTKYIKTLDKRSADAFKAQVQRAVYNSATALVSDMGKRASWSRFIPYAIKIKTSFSAKTSGVRITVDHTIAPYARPYELGNKTLFDENFVNQHGGYRIVKSKKYPNGRRVAVNRSVYAGMKSMRMTSTVLRHPVFHAADQPGGWAAVPLRPFFFAATEAGAPAVQKRMESALDSVAKDLDFKGV